MSFEIKLLLLGLAVYRVAELLVLDDGPISVFDRFRKWLGLNSINPIFKELALLFNCPFCIGVWLAIIGTIIVFPESSIGEKLLIMIAIAGFQAFLEQFSYQRD